MLPSNVTYCALLDCIGGFHSDFSIPLHLIYLLLWHDAFENIKALLKQSKLGSCQVRIQKSFLEIITVKFAAFILLGGTHFSLRCGVRGLQSNLQALCWSFCSRLGLCNGIPWDLLVGTYVIEINSDNDK